MDKSRYAAAVHTYTHTHTGGKVCIVSKILGLYLVYGIKVSHPHKGWFGKYFFVNKKEEKNSPENCLLLVQDERRGIRLSGGLTLFYINIDLGNK